MRTRPHFCLRMTGSSRRWDRGHRIAHHHPPSMLSLSLPLSLPLPLTHPLTHPLPLTLLLNTFLKIRQFLPHHPCCYATRRDHRRYQGTGDCCAPCHCLLLDGTYVADIAGGDGGSGGDEAAWEGAVRWVGGSGGDSGSGGSGSGRSRDSPISSSTSSSSSSSSSSSRHSRISHSHCVEGCT